MVPLFTPSSDVLPMYVFSEAGRLDEIAAMLNCMRRGGDTTRA